MPETEEPATQATPWEYTLTIPHDLRAVTVCRRTLRLILTMHGLIGLVDRIGAWDANPEPPEPPRELAKHLDLEEGRGLGLVRACADLWGWQPLSRNGSKGKYVWCELTTAA